MDITPVGLISSPVGQWMHLKLHDAAGSILTTGGNGRMKLSGLVIWLTSLSKEL